MSLDVHFCRTFYITLASLFLYLSAVILAVAWSVHDIVFFCIFLNRYAPCSFYFYICCATVLTLGLKSRVYGDPYEINDDDDDAGRWGGGVPAERMGGGDARSRSRIAGSGGRASLRPAATGRVADGGGPMKTNEGPGSIYLHVRHIALKIKMRVCKYYYSMC